MNSRCKVSAAKLILILNFKVQEKFLFFFFNYILLITKVKLSQGTTSDSMIPDVSVEKLFSFATWTDVPKFCSWTNRIFEKRVLLRDKTNFTLIDYFDLHLNIFVSSIFISNVISKTNFQSPNKYYFLE